ncbi:MAG: gluconate 2-dehydrogenase subunit 3 family protein [Herpetosiphonaceae bacterium]|nr:gluconate 2-dehydrogenase subunit 3 family protein [Herpetosiphonaceae bacterium]
MDTVEQLAPMLSAQQWATLRVLVDLIIPADDVPGGWEAGVGEYLRRQFQGALQPALPLYRDGLDALEREAHTRGGDSFAMLDSGAQEALLHQIEVGEVLVEWSVSAAGFFAMVVEHVMEGFYSDPANGGNRGAVAWNMIGFEVHG